MKDVKKLGNRKEKRVEQNFPPGPPSSQLEEENQLVQLNVQETKAKLLLRQTQSFPIDLRTKALCALVTLTSQWVAAAFLST